MKRQLQLLTIISVFVLSACDKIAPEGFANRGAPESLLDISAETVSVPLSSDHSIDELIDWVDQDQPTAAQLYCVESDVLCAAAEEVLSLYGVEYEFIPSESNVVNFVYERVLAHDCENRFVDNTINPYNLNHPTYGCSVSSNMLQMVSDRSQFVNPALSGYPDAERALKGYDRYLAEEPDTVSDDRYSVSELESN